MSPDDPAPDDDALPDDIAALFSAERARPGLSDARGDQLLGRVVTSLSGPPTPPAAEAPAAPTPPSAASVGARALSPWTAFVLGGVTGAFVGVVGHAQLQTAPAPQVVRVVERVVAVADAAPVAVAVADVPVEAAAEPSPDAARVVAAPTPRPPPQPPAIEREAVLLERARAAMLHGRPADALDALEEHARAYPRGRLAEERDAMRVQCLVARGDRAGAAARAREFLARHPHSPLADVVRASVAVP